MAAQHIIYINIECKITYFGDQLAKLLIAIPVLEQPTEV